MFYKFLLTFFFFFFTIFIFTSAQNTNNNVNPDSITNLSEVVVTASRINENILKSSVSIEKINNPSFK